MESYRSKIERMTEKELLEAYLKYANRVINFELDQEEFHDGGYTPAGYLKHVLSKKAYLQTELRARNIDIPVP